MTRLYDNSGLARRMNLSCVVVAIAVLFAGFELWRAFHTDDPSTNYLFALLFIGGAFYAAWQMRDATQDSVVTLDVEEASGEGRISFWRPFGSRAIAAPLSRLSDWQFQMKGGRKPAPILTAHHPDHPRPLEFELHSGIKLTDGLRAIAPDAVAAYERRLSG